MNDNETEDLNYFSNQYEINKLVEQFVLLLLDKNRDKEKVEQMADILIELKNVLGWTEERLEEEINDLFSTTPEEMNEIIESYFKNKDEAN